MSDSDLRIFDALKAEIGAFVAPALASKVDSDESSKAALEVARQIKALEKQVEERRKQLIAPLLAEQRLINELAKSTAEDLVRASGHLKSELISWDEELERRRQIELARARAEEEAARAELQARERELDEWRAHQLAKEAIEADPLFGPDPTPTHEYRLATAELEHAFVETSLKGQAERQAIGYMKVQGTSKVWAFSVLNEMQVPRAYLKVDDTLIRKAVRDGVRQINGVRIFEQTRLAIR